MLQEHARKTKKKNPAFSSEWVFKLCQLKDVFVFFKDIHSLKLS